MKDQGNKSSIQSLAAGLLGFVGIIGLGSLVMMHHGGAAAKAPMSVYSPVDADPGGPAPMRPARPAATAAAPAPVSPTGISSPLPVLPVEAARDQSGAAPAAPSAAPANVAASPAGAAPAPKLASLARPDLGGGASSSAAAPPAAAAANDAAKASGKKPAPPVKAELARNMGAVASSVHYGVSGRSELMGRAAGPVYNFSGGSAGKQGGQVAADNAAASGALQQVDAVEKQIDASDVPDADKAKLHEQLKAVRETAPATATP